MGLWGKYWSMGVNSILKHILCFSFFFFISSGLCMTPDLSISRKSVKDAMMQEEEDRMASGLRVA